MHVNNGLQHCLTTRFSPVTFTAHLSGRNPSELPSSGGRQFVSVYDEMLAGLERRVADLRKNTSMVYADITNVAKSFENEETNSAYRMDGKKAVYKQGDSAFQAKSTGHGKKKWSHDDPWGLSTSAVQKDYGSMKSPPLEMFFWNRLICDEFTYILDKKEHERALNIIYRLKSSFRCKCECIRTASLLFVHGSNRPSFFVFKGSCRARPSTPTLMTYKSLPNFLASISA